MTTYGIQTYKDGGHNLGNPGEDKQWVAEVVGGAEAEPVYATTWYATEEEAVRDAAAWLRASERKRARVAG
jgi:hypothetical protein